MNNFRKIVNLILILALLYFLIIFEIYAPTYDVNRPVNLLFGMILMLILLFYNKFQHEHKKHIKSLKIKMIFAAKKGAFINYYLIEDLCSPSSISQMTQKEYFKNKILLGSIIIDSKIKNSDLPNGCPPEFFWNFPNIPKNLKRKRTSYKREPLTSEEIEFVKAEQQKVFDFWKDKSFEEFTDYIDI